MKGSVSKYFCDESAIDDSNLHPGSIPLIMWTSPIGRYATPYYAESHRLAPDDTQLACNYATFALYSNHDSVPMRALVKNGRFRTANGKTFSRIAHEYAYGTRGDALNSTSREDTQLPTRRNAELPAMYYAMALENFQATLDRNPSSAEAISDVGYCLWSWTVDAKVKRFQGPDPQKLAGATTMAEKALRFLPPRQDFNQLIDLDATLVELYIAGGRSQAAVKEIEKLKTELPNDDELFDLDNAIYVYLDSAHAHACASAVSLNDKAKHETATKADLAHIQSLGERNEFRPFGDMKDDFSLDTLREICFDALPLPK